MDRFGQLNEKLADDVKCYVGMQIDSAKLAAVEGLSTVIGKGIALVVLLFLCNTALIFITAALVYWLGMLIDSWPWAAVIVSVVYIIIAVWVFSRPGIFTNKMVRVFSTVFFNPKNHENENV